MKIDWLGHSCFRLTESTGTTIITDPYDPQSLGRPFPTLTADAVTCSHVHPNHSFVDAVNGAPVVLDKLGSFDVKGVHLESVPTKGTDGQRNLAFIYRMDGVDVCHLGDIGNDCTPDMIEEITPIDVLFLPIGGNGYTIDARDALEYIALLMPEVVIPMHYRMDDNDNDFDFDTLREFVKHFDDDNVTYLSENQSMEFERDDFTGKSVRIIVPKPLS